MYYNLKHISIITLLTILISCNKNSEESITPVTTIKDVKMSFELKRPSSHYATDGAIFLKLEPEIELKSIIWSIRKSGYPNGPGDFYSVISNNKNLANIGPEEYFVKIIDKDDSVFNTSVFLASYDTIYPKEYYPAYPGSWWYYSNGDTVRCSDEYKACAVKKNFYIDQVYTYDYVYVPVVDGHGIFEYTYLNPIASYSGLACECFFCDSLHCGFSVSGYKPTSYGWIYGHNINSDTIIIAQNKVYNNVMAIEKVYFQDMYYTVKRIERLYYAKNIGLIKVEHSDSGFHTDYELLDYKINHN